MRGAVNIVKMGTFFKKNLCVPHLPTFISFLFQLLNEPGLGAGIDPGMALTPFLTSNG